MCRAVLPGSGPVHRPAVDRVLRQAAHEIQAIQGEFQRGSGLAEHVLRDALLPFYSTKPAGTGLGLTLCREIVEAHEGRLSIANREGGGALVTFWLPG